MPIHETDIQKQILDYLRLKGYLAWRQQSIPVPIRRGKAIVGLRRADEYNVGMPDIMCLYAGRLIGIEVKTDKGKQSADQERWEKLIFKHGGLYILARSLDEIIKIEKLI